MQTSCVREDPITLDQALHHPRRATGPKRTSPSGTHPFSHTRLARMHRALQRHVDSGYLPGLVALVQRDGAEYVEAIGTTGFDSDLPMRRDTIFRLASTTKPITAVGAMVLVEECLLRLDDPVDEWLPELKERRVLRTIDSQLDDTVAAQRSMTVRDLLGVLIARVAGKPLGEFLRERIFEPLGMTDTGFRVPQAKLARLPACYGSDMVTGDLVALHDAGGGYAARQSGGFESGAGGLVSTADDLLAFGRMMLASGGERVLSRPSIELMTRDHLTAEQKAASPFFKNFWETYGWGLGLGIVTAHTDLAHRPGRFGWDGAFGTSWYVDPGERLVGVLMGQRRPDRLALPPVTLDFWTSVYQLIER